MALLQEYKKSCYLFTSIDTGVMLLNFSIYLFSPGNLKAYISFPSLNMNRVRVQKVLATGLHRLPNPYKVYDT